MGVLRVLAGSGAVALALLLVPPPPHGEAAPAPYITAEFVARTSASSAALVPRADAVATAEGRAKAAQAEVDALLDRYATAERQVDDGVAKLSASFALAASAEVTRDEAAAQAQRARARQGQDARAVYAAGGPASIGASILTADDASDALWRASTAGRIMANLLRDNRTAAQRQQADADLQNHRAVLTEQASQAQADALKELQSDADAAQTALAQAQHRLDTLDRKAKKARAARESARLIAAARARAETNRRAAMGPVTAIGIPAGYEADYRNAAKTCPGVPWTLLAGVGQVESGHGRNNGPSSAGAVGPMQFMPATFKAYAVDGDHDGVTDPWDPEDAIFTAAHYLCVSGAEGGSAAGIHAALLAYNHAEWYVDLVLAAQSSIEAKAGQPGQPG